MSSRRRRYLGRLTCAMLQVVDSRLSVLGFHDSCRLLPSLINDQVGTQRLSENNVHVTLRILCRCLQRTAREMLDTVCRSHGQQLLQLRAEAVLETRSSRAPRPGSSVLQLNALSAAACPPVC